MTLVFKNFLPKTDKLMTCVDKVKLEKPIQHKNNNNRIYADLFIKRNKEESRKRNLNMSTSGKRKSSSQKGGEQKKRQTLTNGNRKSINNEDISSLEQAMTLKENSFFRKYSKNYSENKKDVSIYLGDDDSEEEEEEEEEDDSSFVVEDEEISDNYDTSESEYSGSETDITDESDGDWDPEKYQDTKEDEYDSNEEAQIILRPSKNRGKARKKNESCKELIQYQLEKSNAIEKYTSENKDRRAIRARKSLIDTYILNHKEVVGDDVVKTDEEILFISVEFMVKSIAKLFNTRLSEKERSKYSKLKLDELVNWKKRDVESARSNKYAFAFHGWLNIRRQLYNHLSLLGEGEKVKDVIKFMPFCSSYTITKKVPSAKCSMTDEEGVPCYVVILQSSKKGQMQLFVRYDTNTFKMLRAFLYVWLLNTVVAEFMKKSSLLDEKVKEISQSVGAVYQIYTEECLERIIV